MRKVRNFGHAIQTKESGETIRQNRSGWQGTGRGRRLRRLFAAGIVLTAFGVIPCGGKLENPFVMRAQADTLVELDSFTGEALQTEDGTGEAVLGRVWITNTMYYDTKQKLYGYYAGDEDVYANVADGMIVRGTVSIQIPDYLTATLYLDGYSVAFTGGELETPGSYTLEITDNGQTTQLFSFTIINGVTNQVLSYSMPEGFRITDAKRDGEAISWTRNFVDMATEGRYIISYECSKAMAPYTLDVTVDTTPPTLVIEGLDEKGRARGPVAISGKADSDTLVVLKDGEEYSTALSRVLTQTGKYVATVTDPAGNATSYSFTILLYLDRNGAIFGILFLAVVIAVVALFIYYKKHLRVR